MNVRVDLDSPIRDGMEVVFKTPCDASEVTGLNVYYPVDGVLESQNFTFADANAKDLGHLDALFAKDAVVKVILDLDTNMAFVQNADTNAYLEGRFAEIEKQIGSGGGGASAKDLDMQGNEIRNVMAINVEDPECGEGFRLEFGSAQENESNHLLPYGLAVFSEKNNGGDVILRGVAPGLEDTDATNLAQLTEVSNFVYRKTEGSEGSINLLPPTLTSGNLADDGYTITASSSCVASEFFPVKPGKKIAHTRITTGTTRAITGLWKYIFYGEDKTVVSVLKQSGSLLPSKAVDVPENAAYARVVLDSSTSGISHKPMVEYTEDGTTISPVFVEYVAPVEPSIKRVIPIPYEGKNICVFGDSLAASGSGGTDTWIQRVGDALLCNKVYNRGVGGSRVTGTDSSGNAVTQYAYVNAEGDAYNRLSYTSKQTVSGYTEISAIGSSVDRANTIPTDTDAIFVLFGANDVGNTKGDTFDADYRTMLDNIYARVPSADIYLCTMPFHKGFDLSESASVYEGYRDRIRKIGAEYGFPVIELKNEMMVNKNNYTKFMDSDNVHYNNNAGRDRTARVALASIKRFN